MNLGSSDNTHSLLHGGHTHKALNSGPLLMKDRPWLTVCLFWIPIIEIIFGYQRQSLLLPELDSGSNLAHGPVQCCMEPKLTGWHVESKIIDWKILYLFSFKNLNLVNTHYFMLAYICLPPPTPKQNNLFLHVKFTCKVTRKLLIF